MNKECERCKDTDLMVFIMFITLFIVAVVMYWLGRGDCGSWL